MIGLTVVVGYGDAALDVLRHLPLHCERPDVVVDLYVVALTGALANGARVVRGDGRDICVLRQAGVPSAVRVVVAVPDDHDGGADHHGRAQSQPDGDHRRRRP